MRSEPIPRVSRFALNPGYGVDDGAAARDRTSSPSSTKRSNRRRLAAGTLSAMALYRSNRIAGATYFFTATLQDRRSAILVEHIDALGSALRTGRARHPFSLLAIVVLP